MPNIDDHFKGRHFDREIIILCVRWYLRFKLSFRDLVEMMAERGIYLVHTTIMRWMQRYARNSKNAGAASHAKLVRPGASMKHTSRSKAAGPIFTEPPTKRERPLISCSAPNGMRQSPKRFSVGRSKTTTSCRASSPLMATMLHIGRRGKPSMNICAANGPKFDPRNI